MSKKIVLTFSLFILLCACSARPAEPVTEITVETADFAYSPSAITVPAGEPITLTLKNTGSVEHDFVVEEIDVRTTIIQDGGSDGHHAHGEEQHYDLHVSADAGQTSVLQLTVSEPGMYRVFCSVEGHEAAGMIGELIVRAQE